MKQNGGCKSVDEQLKTHQSTLVAHQQQQTNAPPFVQYKKVKEK